MKKLLIFIIAISFVVSQNTDCPKTFGSTNADTFTIALKSTPGIYQQYKAPYNGEVSSIQLRLDASSASVYVAIYTSLQNSTIYAKSSTVNKPAAGDVLFTFHTPWTQIEGNIYYIAPVNTTSSTFNWYAKSGSIKSGSCVAYHPNKYDCTHQASLFVNYIRTDCCAPGCYNGGTCQTNSTCSCVAPWGSANCLCYEGLVETENGTCVEETCESGSCVDTCSTSVSYPEYNCNTPLGLGWLLPAQFYLPTEYGYPTQLQMWISGTANAAGNPLYVDIVEYPSMYTLTSTTNITLGSNEYTTVFFSFLRPWFQDPAKKYLIYPRDPNIGTPEYRVNSICGLVSDPCGYGFRYNAINCNSRLSFAIEYDKVCYNDGICSAGNCTCINGYNGTSCEFAPYQEEPTTTTTTTTTSATSTTGASDSVTNTKSHYSSNSAVIGGAIGGMALLVIIIVVIAFFVKKKKAKKMKSVKSRDSMEEEIDLEAVQVKFQIIKDILIGKKLGEGNFGEVYHGLWNGTDVALKKINIGEDEALQQEAVMLTSLQHPNVIRLLGIYTSETTKEKYLVMEYVAKGSLESLLKKERKLTFQDKISMIISSCRGMAYLEERGIIHRDISARNILVNKENDKYTCKISDFGLSRNTKMYNMEGKVLPIRWAAPEMLKEEVCTIKGDVWSFGIVMWEIMEQSLPYPEMLKNKEVMDFVLGGGRLEKPTGCPDDLFKLMLHCWTENPELRPTFATILEKVLSMSTKEEIITDEDNEKQTNYNN